MYYIVFNEENFKDYERENGMIETCAYGYSSPPYDIKSRVMEYCDNAEMFGKVKTLKGGTYVIHPYRIYDIKPLWSVETFNDLIKEDICITHENVIMTAIRRNQVDVAKIVYEKMKSEGRWERWKDNCIWTKKKLIAKTSECFDFLQSIGIPLDYRRIFQYAIEDSNVKLIKHILTKFDNCHNNDRDFLNAVKKYKEDALRIIEKEKK